MNSYTKINMNNRVIASSKPKSSLRNTKIILNEDMAKKYHVLKTLEDKSSDVLVKNFRTVATPITQRISTEESEKIKSTHIRIKANLIKKEMELTNLSAINDQLIVTQGNKDKIIKDFCKENIEHKNEISYLKREIDSLKNHIQKLKSQVSYYKKAVRDLGYKKSLNIDDTIMTTSTDNANTTDPGNSIYTQYIRCYKLVNNTDEDRRISNQKEILIKDSEQPNSNSNNQSIQNKSNQGNYHLLETGQHKNSTSGVNFYQTQPNLPHQVHIRVSNNNITNTVSNGSEVVVKEIKRKGSIRKARLTKINTIDHYKRLTLNFHCKFLIFKNIK
jgi:hypothetical protein